MKHTPHSLLKLAGWALLAMAAAVAVSTASAGPPRFYKIDDQDRFQLYLDHSPPAMPPHVHNVPGLPADSWATPITLSTFNIDVQSATVRMDAQHLIALHAGEPAPGPMWSHVWCVGAAPARGPRSMSHAVRLGHGNHFDGMVGTLTIWCTAAGTIGGPVHFTASGVHDDSGDANNGWPLTAAGSDAQVVPPTVSDAFCTVSAMVNQQASEVSFSILVALITRADLLAAEIALGRPGENGPAIFDLGPPEQWDDLEGMGIARTITATPFPMQYLNDLVAGNSYVILRTVAYPAGEIRGQLVSAQLTLWDTGAPHMVLYNGSPSYVGFPSGNLAGQPQRWAAVPFRIPSEGAVISGIDADWFIRTGFEAETINYIIWQRTGLAQPQSGDERAVGVLGSFGAGVDDPRTPETDNWLHLYDGLNIPLPGGDYYFTMYAAGIGAGNTTGYSDSPWLTGGDLQAEDLEQPFVWRSSSFPTPGFYQYNDPALQPTYGQDPDDRWSPCFAIYGTVHSQPRPCRGDTNCDDTISYGDINPFVVALNDLSAWQAQNPGCPWQNVDTNDDGIISYGDINPFVVLLNTHPPCP